jgi:nucleoside-diphosphate-sugar epimerase
MNIFVTGATGVLGRGAVRTLAEQGHQVRGVARTDAKASWLRDHGAEPVAVDLFDEAAVKDAVAGSDAVLHLATHIPEMKDMRKEHAWEENNRLRTLTSRLLVDAALTQGVSSVVAESITFCYPDRGATWIDESVPFTNDPWLTSVGDLEREVGRFTEHGGRGIVLRFGSFYGPDARNVDEYLNLARKGVSPFIGPPDAYMSSIHTDDASAAVVAALDAPAGTYNVCDEPMTRREVAEAFSVALGTRKLHFMPQFAVKVATRKTGDILLRSQRVSNRKFRDAAGWEPRFTDVKVGLADVGSRRANAS